MTKYEPLPEGLSSLDLPKSQFIARCVAWIEKFNDGKPIEIDDVDDCPIQQYIVHNHANCGDDLVAGITECPFCGAPCCPTCSNHNVTQLSRVTGYMSSVDGWNASKKQELKDRTRTNFEGR